MNKHDDERPMILGCGRALLRNRVAAAEAVTASNPEGHNQYTMSENGVPTSAAHQMLKKSGYKATGFKDFGVGTKATTERNYEHPDGHKATIQTTGSPNKAKVFSETKDGKHQMDLMEKMYNLKVDAASD